MYNDWRDNHYKIMVAFLSFLNANTSNFILKGGTSLMLCYGLDRFSEDIDLDDLNSVNIIPFVDRFCENLGIVYMVAEDDNTVKRCMINYGGEKLLKVEVSYRGVAVTSSTTNINGLVVYTIQTLASSKIMAYARRDKIRDLYDILFIFKNYMNVLPKNVVAEFASAIEYKGLEYFDYMIRTQSDELIDSGKLAEDFMEMYYWLGYR